MEINTAIVSWESEVKLAVNYKYLHCIFKALNLLNLWQNIGWHKTQKLINLYRTKLKELQRQTQKKRAAKQSSEKNTKEGYRYSDFCIILY